MRNLHFESVDTTQISKYAHTNRCQVKNINNEKTYCKYSIDQ